MKEEDIDWTPIKYGGATFRTKDFVYENDKIYFVRTKKYIRIINCFAIPIIAFFSIFSIALISNNDAIGAILFINILLLTSIAIYVSWLRNKPTQYFDLNKRIYFSGEDYIDFADISGLQILSEYIASHGGEGENNGGASYELNLLRENSYRVNVIDYGDINYIRENAQRIAELLDVQVWEKPKIKNNRIIL